MKRFCTVLFAAAVLLAAVLSASCSDVSSASQGGGDTAQVPGGGTAPGAGEEGSRDTIILHAQYPYIYVWESGVSGLDNKQSEMKAESDGWYYFEIKSSSAKVIFKPNADDDWSGQTEDLYAIAGEWWYNGSELSDTKPSGGQSDTKLSAPENVTATASGSSSITVSWDAVDGADRYTVYYRSYSGTDDTCKRNGTEKTKSTENTSVLIQQLEYKCYLFWVTAENSAGESEESMWAYAMPNSSSGSGGSGTTTTLSAPTGLTATAQSSSEITLSWNAVSGASSYNIYYGTNSSNANARLYTSSATTRCTVSSLSANTMYYFWTKACASDGTESGFSNFANARTNAVSSGSGGSGGSPTVTNDLLSSMMILDLFEKPIINTYVKLTDGKNGFYIPLSNSSDMNAAYYILYRSTTSKTDKSEYKKIKTVPKSSNIAFEDFDIDFTKNKTYYYIVVAVDSKNATVGTMSTNGTSIVLGDTRIKYTITADNSRQEIKRYFSVDDSNGSWLTYKKGGAKYTYRSLDPGTHSIKGGRSSSSLRAIVSNYNFLPGCEYSINLDSGSISSASPTLSSTSVRGFEPS